MVIYFMANSLAPKAEVSIDKVRKGSKGYSLQLKVVREEKSPKLPQQL